MSGAIIALLFGVFLVGVYLVLVRYRRIEEERAGIPSKDGYLKERTWADPPLGMSRSARIVDEVVILGSGRLRAILDLSHDRSIAFQLSFSTGKRWVHEDRGDPMP